MTGTIILHHCLYFLLSCWFIGIVFSNSTTTPPTEPPILNPSCNVYCGNKTCDPLLARNDNHTEYNLCVAANLPSSCCYKAIGAVDNQRKEGEANPTPLALFGYIAGGIFGLCICIAFYVGIFCLLRTRCLQQRVGTATGGGAESTQPDKLADNATPGDGTAAGGSAGTSPDPAVPGSSGGGGGGAAANANTNPTSPPAK